MTAPIPPRRIVLSLPSVPSLGLIVLSGFNGGSDVVQRATVNLKRSAGYTPGGGLKIVRSGAFNPKFIWTVKSLVTDEVTAINYRELVLLQQDSQIGQVVLTDQNSDVNARETGWGTRSVVPDSTTTVGVTTRSEIAAKVFLEDAGDNADIIRPVGKGGWEIEFTATEV